MKYPIGVQSFEKLREEDYVYVDKTPYIYPLTLMGSYYFLSRPRRFGKSLLVSTLEAYFKGKKHLFEGLAINMFEREWRRYPVLRVDFNTGDYTKAETLEKVLEEHLAYWEDTYGKSASEGTYALRFKGIVRRAYEKTGRKVVILVDEYDKPLIESLDNETQQDANRRLLREFYSVLKTQDQYIRFAFLTGVTKFSKVSIFSDLNNIKDISLDKNYDGICGISQQELEMVFHDSIALMASKNDMTVEECKDKLRQMYDGYHFSIPSEGMYNPYSLLNAFADNEFSDYWFQSGTPTFLVELLKKSDVNIDLLEKEPVSADLIGCVDSFDENLVPFFYQSGYLTLAEYDKEFRCYKLKFPNAEVEQGLTRFLLPYYTSITKKQTITYLQKFVKDVTTGNAESFLETLKTVLDGSDYRIAGDKEIYFQNCMYIIFKLMGFYVEVERCTSRGRIDIVLGTKDYLYVMELKVSATAQEALRQIDEKGYMLPFKQDSRKLVKIGVAFNLDTRTLTEWQIEGL